ncbi:hypothetical protein BH20ACT2_BH20ACT2_04550 [soil metagenome]
MPQAIVDQAPEDEGSLAPERFRWRPEVDATQPTRPSRRRALEALPEGGTVLDVGVGGGASSLGLLPTAGRIVGVDPLAGMLESFEASARAAGVATRTVLGVWPDVVDEVEPADIVVCHHAVYRVVEIEDFVAALTARARHRVVLEVSARHPLASLDGLVQALHGFEPPDWLVADELFALLDSLGLAVEREDIVLAPQAREITPQLVAFTRRRLFVGAARDPEIESFLRAQQPREHRVAALWWPGAA